jgi:hypothetical protein
VSEEIAPNEKPLTLYQCRADFWKLAHRSIAYGLVTLAEVSVIYRPGTRKEIYWCRHLKDLQELVEERKKSRSKSLQRKVNHALPDTA